MISLAYILERDKKAVLKEKERMGHMKVPKYRKKREGHMKVPKGIKKMMST